MKQQENFLKDYGELYHFHKTTGEKLNSYLLENHTMKSLSKVYNSIKRIYNLNDYFNSDVEEKDIRTKLNNISNLIFGKCELCFSIENDSSNYNKIELVEGKSIEIYIDLENSDNSYVTQFTQIIWDFSDVKKRKFNLYQLRKKFNNLIIYMEQENSSKGIVPVRAFEQENHSILTNGLLLNDISTLLLKGTEISQKEKSYSNGVVKYTMNKNTKLTTTHLYFLTYLLANINNLVERQEIDISPFMKCMNVNVENKTSVWDYNKKIKRYFKDLQGINVSYEGKGKTPTYKNRAIFQHSHDIDLKNGKLKYYFETAFIEDIKKFPHSFVLPTGLFLINPYETREIQVYLKLFSHFIQNYKKDTKGILNVELIGKFCGIDFTGKNLTNNVNRLISTLEKLEKTGVIQLLGFKNETNYYKSVEEIKGLTSREKLELKLVYVPNDVSLVRELGTTPETNENPQND